MSCIKRILYRIKFDMFIPEACCMLFFNMFPRKKSSATKIGQRTLNPGLIITLPRYPRFARAIMMAYGQDWSLWAPGREFWWMEKCFYSRLKLTATSRVGWLKFICQFRSTDHAKTSFGYLGSKSVESSSHGALAAPELVHGHIHIFDRLGDWNWRK